MTLAIRPAIEADLAAIAAIYGEAVATGTASFELAPPGRAEMTRRFETLRAGGFPYLAAIGDEGRVLGYAYAGPYRPRAAYRDTAENSVYVRPETIGQGIGTALLRTLIVECEALGLRQMVAVVGDSGNTASIRLHERCGFRLVGVLEAVGYKHGQWLDSVLLQRTLGPGKDTPPQHRNA